MQFTYRNPGRSSTPQRALPGARSVVVGAWAYHRRPAEVPGALSGRVASYAWTDHYAKLRCALEAVADRLRADGWQARVHSDDNSLVDRNVAFNAGLGWYGKNANLLLPGQGSWFVLGAVVTDAALAPTGPPLVDGCGPCVSCIDACPTGAIIAPGVVDARRCLAWLVQGPGEIPVKFRDAVGDRLYGCDDCQDVCPPNLRSGAVEVEAEAEADPWVQIRFVLLATDEELLARVGRWYIAKRDPNVVRRTAVVILGNTGDPTDPEVRELIGGALGHPSGLVRSHAVWAARKLGLHDSLVALDGETAPEVLAELNR